MGAPAAGIPCSAHRRVKRCEWRSGQHAAVPWHDSRYRGAGCRAWAVCAGPCPAISPWYDATSRILAATVASAGLLGVPPRSQPRGRPSRTTSSIRSRSARGQTISPICAVFALQSRMAQTAGGRCLPGNFRSSSSTTMGDRQVALSSDQWLSVGDHRTSPLRRSMTRGTWTHCELSASQGSVARAKSPVGNAECSGIVCNVRDLMGPPAMRVGRV